MSDSDSGPEFLDYFHLYHTVFNVADVIYERWNKIPVILKKKAAQLMKLYAFWYHILLRQENHNTTRWAVQVGFLDSNVSNDLSLKRLHKIEILEAILRAMEKGCVRKVFHVPDVLDDAIRWLERTGEPRIKLRVQELGPIGNCFAALQLIFTECKNHFRAVCPPLLLIWWSDVLSKSEEMKTRGNDQFQKKKYDAAVKCYSKAIRYHPENHIIYGNRALCYIRSEKYLKAVGDGKRATLIQPEWAKGHYRYCEALFLLGEHKQAIEANEWGQTLCKADPEGMKDLLQQHVKFNIEIEESKCHRSKSRPESNRESVERTENCSRAVLQGGMGKNVSLSMCKTDRDIPQATYSCNHSKRCSRDPSVRDALMSAVQDAHMALADQRCRNAEQAFSQALSFLVTSTPKELGLCTLDQVVLIYGHASALIEIGQPEELAEAQKDFEKIKHFEERKFQCLVFYGIGKAYQKENRFPLALEQFSDSMQMVKKKITPGKLTWPTTKVIVEESKLDYFKESIEMCKFPPKPDAICRHQNCHGHSKIEIYFTDPDFKGFIRMVCCQSCKVEYHINCWKKLKATAFSDKNEKDFLQGMCFTPDCEGRICHIKIYGSTGLVKCEFEASIDKPMGKATLRVNQKCTSLKKLKSREDRKLRRKQHRQDASLSTQFLTVEHPSPASSPAWLAYGDRVLLQISERIDLFRAESHNISVLMENLKPWMDLDQIKGNKLGTSYTERQVESLGDVVELLLEKKNRVWARVFIHGLSSCLVTSPKLHDWAHQLNSAGLNSAALFIDRYADHLEQLDLAPLLNFAPLQDMLIEKFGTMPEFFSRLGLTLTEYLKQAPSQEMRLFIWTLEEHRDQYTTCHTVLDDYFELMGKHLDLHTFLTRGKNRNRKKKQKEPKGSVIVLSGMRGGTSREEDDEDFLHDSLMFLDSTDPFSIPNHLRNQVAEFEGQYNIGSRSSHYNRILDNNPDPTKESLYDYFAQILEEYGPLGAQDPLLVGELDNFPPDAQQKIQEAGGLEHFLLESLRFVMTDNLLGLMKMDNLDFIGDIPNGLSLNPSAMEFLPNSHDSGPRDYDEPFAIINVRPNPVEFTGYLEVTANLPSPYVLPVFGAPPAPPTNEIASAIGTLRAEDMSYNNHDPRNLEAFDLYISGVDEQGFNAEFEQQIQQMKQDYGAVKQRRQTEISALEGEQEEINHSIQIIHKELGLFQQKLEEEVKKDQQEKKENQETLKALKIEIKELAESQESISKNIHKKNKEYETQLNNFLELSNQSAAEKMSLEDEIKRCRDLCAKATRRSQGAEVCGLNVYVEIPACSSEFCLCGLPSQILQSATEAWIACAQEAEEKIRSTEVQKNNANKHRFNYWDAISNVTITEDIGHKVHRLLRAGLFVFDSFASRPPAPQPTNVYDRIVDRLSVMFPHYSRPVLSKFIGEMRTANRGCLNSLSYQEVINRVAQLILDHQDSTRDFLILMYVCLVQLNMEDPCIICHEDMSQEDLCVLECRHSFHRECIKSWLKEQSTCPTCREHALLPEDFPLLPGRIRRGHTPAAFS
uniref:RING-type E3 ubiquitin transferase n=1 Tax=Oncorhynchus mykiss TaxID=8022 RepID=A0A8C7SHB5_ONCMY